MLMLRMNVKNFQITGSEKDKKQHEIYVEKLNGFINEGLGLINNTERKKEINIINESIKVNFNLFKTFFEYCKLIYK